MYHDRLRGSLSGCDGVAADSAAVAKEGAMILLAVVAPLRRAVSLLQRRVAAHPPRAALIDVGGGCVLVAVLVGPVPPIVLLFAVQRLDGCLCRRLRADEGHRHSVEGGLHLPREPHRLTSATSPPQGGRARDAGGVAGPFNAHHTP